jgi:hypothetical protein
LRGQRVVLAKQMVLLVSVPTQIELTNIPTQLLVSRWSIILVFVDTFIA